MRRSKLIEDSAGKGILKTVDGSHSSPVNYRFVVEIEQIRAGDAWIDGLREIEARVDVDDDFAWSAMLEDVPLVLELNDGRWFECWLSGDGLLVARTGHALHERDNAFRPAQT